ncbi:hypothetical protein DL89DRAFT_263936 [Linderina pennispora]|uniref:Transferase n=1 Tax=Linderina pennispora TaxID=61395 RepID=A0A1Y1WK50_9FUNG|nr:uncharacterized protein DL89DRAFT_263936 [Linderina pennispora]ORX73919.1 hypothetical protein DL89DRAFT_263936 [Linderina pennispora]
MDDLLDKIESGVYPLSAFDEIISYVNIRHVNFYSNRDATTDFMPADKLETAFYKTLSLFPLFVGDLSQRADGRMEIVIDKDNLNIPGYMESQSDVSFSDIESLSFNQSTWPTNLSTTGTIACPDAETNRIKLANIHVIRLKDNSGVIISTSFAHAVTDGYGCFEFLNCWGDQTRALITGQPVQESRYCFDRAVIRRLMPSERAPLNQTTRDMYTKSSYLTNWISWLSPSMRGKLMRYSSSKNPVEGCLFRIPRVKLDELRSQVLNYVPPGTRISDNDLISALTYKVLTQATMEATGGGSGWISSAISRAMGIKDGHCLGISCDVRHRLGMEDLNYIGNPIHQVFIPTSAEYATRRISPEALATIAFQVRQAVSLATPPYIGSLYELLESGGTSLGNFIVGMTSYRLTLWISNQTRFGIYKADFGNGVQSFATIIPDFGEGSIILLPSPPPCKDVLVNLTVSPKVKENILKNEFWTNIAEFFF